jgi:hypothetical protein
MTVDHQSYHFKRPQADRAYLQQTHAVERRDALRNVVNRLRERQLSE